MNKMQKHTLAKVLKVIFYLLGFPLLLVLVAKDSMPFFDETMYDGNAATGIWVVAILWLGITLVQIGLYLVMKKQQALRTIIVVILSLVFMLVPFAAMDKKNEEKINELQQEYAGKGVTINSYSLQKQHYVTLYEDLVSYADSTMNQVNDLIRVYGLEGYYPHVYRTHTQLNTTIYYVTADGTRYEWDEWDDIEDQSPIAYNQNGLLADNYIFGVENVIDLLIKYNNYSGLTVYREVNKGRYTDATAMSEANKNKWYVIDANGKYARYVYGDPIDYDTTIFYEALAIEDAYNLMVDEISGETTYAYGSDAWTTYTTAADAITDTRTGKKTSYAALKAEADEYVLTDQRLNDVLQVVFEYLGAAPGLNTLIDRLNLDAILDLVGALLTEDEADIDGGAIGSVVTQLLYGYKGQTTGLALPAQYLFNNITLKDTSTVKESVGFVNVDMAPSDAEAEGYKTFTVTYSYDSTNDEYTAKVAYVDFDSANVELVTEIPTADEIKDSSDPSIYLGKAYTTGEVFKATPITEAYNTYVTNLKANYSGTTDGGYDYTAIAALTDLIKSLQPALGLVGSLLSGDTVLGLVGGLIDGLDLESILGAILKEGALDKIVNDLISGIDLTGITVNGVKDLLIGILGDISYYQHPLLQMCWQEDFLTESDKKVVATDGTEVNLAEYAWNKYACEDFGIANGCALVAKGGLLAGTTLGTDTPADEAFTQAELYQLQADISYQTEMYPRLSARRYINMWYGMIAVSIFFSTYFYNKEKRYLYEAMILDGGEF